MQPPGLKDLLSRWLHEHEQTAKRSPRRHALFSGVEKIAQLRRWRSNSATS
jgi:hypothetical protein